MLAGVVGKGMPGSCRGFPVRLKHDSHEARYDHHHISKS